MSMRDFTIIVPPIYKKGLGDVEIKDQLIIRRDDGARKREVWYVRGFGRSTDGKNFMLTLTQEKLKK